MDIRAAEISAILKEQIKNFGTEAEVTEVGQVLSVGDGIARCYGLDKVQADVRTELARLNDVLSNELAAGTRGMPAQRNGQAAPANGNNTAGTHRRPGNNPKGQESVGAGR